LLWQRFAARAGILALVLQVLFPVHGFAAAVDGVRVPVCTGGGIVWKVLDNGSEAPAPATDRLGADCPFCLIHAAAFAPAALAALPVPTARPLHVPRPVPAAAHVSRYLCVHPSRGPPAAA
jgi:hypothetical protein